MKIWNPKKYHHMFRTQGKQATPERYQNLEFQTLKDSTSTPDTLPHDNPFPRAQEALSEWQGPPR